jgi:hypothetical protein
VTNNSRARTSISTVAVAAVAFALVWGVSPAAATITIGQNAPAPPPATNCTSLADAFTPTVTDGNSYVVPEEGRLTSWSTNAAAGNGQQLTMKVFRQVSGNNYSVVGHVGPNGLAGGLVNVFAADIPVKVGDIVGINSANAATVNNGCSFTVPGNNSLALTGSLPDGGSGTFANSANRRMNISAVLEPTNLVTIGAAVLNKKNGTASLTVNVPNPGQVSLSGTGVTPASAHAAVAVSAPGPVTLLVSASGKKKKKLKSKGKVSVGPIVTFTPTGGTASTQATSVLLKKKKKK